MTVSVPLWRDVDRDHVGQAAVYDSGRTELYRNGELYAKGRNDQPGYAQLTVPDDDADYRLRLAVQRSPGVDLAWRMFLCDRDELGVPLGPPGRRVVGPAATAAARVRPDAGPDQPAPADAVYPVRLTATGQPGYDAGQVVAAPAWVSYGDPVQLT